MTLEIVTVRTTRMIWTVLQFVLVMAATMSTSVLGFSPSERSLSVLSKATVTTPTSVYYIRGKPLEPAIETPPLPLVLTSSKAQGTPKAKIETITCLSELQYFLEQDDRPVAIK